MIRTANGTQLTGPYAEGYAARKLGQPRDTNPYTRPDDEWRDWVKYPARLDYQWETGWRIADYDAARQPERCAVCGDDLDPRFHGLCPVCEENLDLDEEE